jgi:hypothetical protein
MLVAPMSVTLCAAPRRRRLSTAEAMIVRWVLIGAVADYSTRVGFRGTDLPRPAGARSLRSFQIT